MLLNGFFKTFYISISYVKEKIENFYKNSTLYEKKISRTLEVEFNYKPSPYLLSSLINYQSKKYKIDDFDFNKIWVNKKETKKFKKLNNFFGFLVLILNPQRN